MSSSMTGQKRSTNVPMDKNHGYKRACPRCGLTRTVRKKDQDKLCSDCVSVEPNWPDSVKMAG